jgi:serine protease inhibitor
MMFTKRKFLYAEDNDVQVLGLPYRGGDLCMFAFLPKDPFGLSKFEKELSGKHLLSMVGSAKDTEVIVS